jgi:hypothetical protein
MDEINLKEKNTKKTKGLRKKLKEIKMVEN